MYLRSFKMKGAKLYANLIVLLIHVTAQDLMQKDKLLLLKRLEKYTVPRGVVACEHTVKNVR